MKNALPSLETTHATDAMRWLMVCERQPSNAFLYAVRSTGIYCRPGCASRLPKRENVLFFDTVQQAEEAQFRACKRCQPNRPSGETNAPEWLAAVYKQIEIAETPLSLDELAAIAGFSPTYFQKQFKAVVGISPKAFLAERQRQKLQTSLTSRCAVTDAMQDAGFNQSGNFYPKADQLLGMTPKEYQKGGVGLTIHYATGKSALGWVLIATTERGICGIDLAANPAILIARLHQRFNQAELIEEPVDLSEWLAAVIAKLQHPGRAFDLPLDLLGTAFQRKVWQALQEIPAGQTTTYSELATQLGQANATRAVAKACATNEIAVVIPCHRVVGKDGQLRGYRWGLDLKQSLLEQEKALDNKNFYS
jgi:AraC family transcriptional regulator of adaptative response/methylated-DNA-[protein]-cysteine methyltransferase